MAFANTTISARSIFNVASFDGIRRALGRGLHAVQVARMNTVLREMSAVQLREIGITQSEITDYADMLMLQETRT